MADYESHEDDWGDFDTYTHAFAARHGKGSLGPFSGSISTNTITTKVPPLFDGTQSWFAYEKAIDEWVDLTELPEEKQGPALKARLEGEAARYKEFLDRELLKQKGGRGVAYFKETIRARYLKSTQVIFLWRFMKFFEMHRRNEEFHSWLSKMALAFKKLKEAWGDVFEPYTASSPEFTAAKLLGHGSSRPSSAGSAPRAQGTAKARPKAKERATRPTASAASGADAPVPEDDDDEGEQDPFLDATPEEEEPEEDPDTILLRKLNEKAMKAHLTKFPLGDNLMGLMLVAMADLNEAQRLSFTSATVTQKLKIPQYTFDNITEIFTELFCANKTAFNNPFLNTRTGGRSFFIVDEGEYEEETGYWAVDEDTQEEGFLPEYGETFWIYDGNAYFGRRLTHGRNLKRPGKGKGKFKSRFSSKPGFKSRRKKGRKGRSYETEETLQEEDEEEENVDEDTSLAVKGKKGGKSFGPPKGAPNSDPSQEAKGGKKGRRKPGKGKGTANVAEDVPRTSSSFFVTEVFHDDPNGDQTLVSTSWTPLRERKENLINISEHPTFVILDIGCTRCMGSRKAVNAFLEAWKRRGNEAEMLRSNASFKFANSHASHCTEKLRIWFKTKPAIYTDVDIVEEGNVPILLSLPQMQNLRFQFDASPDNVFLTCESLAYKRRPLKMSTSKHLVLDLCDIVAPVFQTVVSESQYEAKYQGIHPSFVARELPSQEEVEKGKDSEVEEDEADRFDRVFVALTKEQIQQLIAKKGYVCDRCDRGWVRTHHDSCPRRGMHGKQKSRGETSDDVIPPVTIPPPTSEIQEASVRKRLIRKSDGQEPSSKRYSDPDQVIGGKENGGEKESLSEASGSVAPADHPKPKSTGTPVLAGDQPAAKPPNQTTSDTTSKEPSLDPEEEEKTFPKTIQKLHSRLMNDLELYKLHIKHYHMPLSQFKRRTDQLYLPTQIYEKYDKICKECKLCASKRPAPHRSRVTGLRAREFGDLVFVDHADLKLAGKTYLILVVLDAATSLIWAAPLTQKNAKLTLRAFRDWMDYHNCRPKHVFGDMAFFEPEFLNFWHFHNIRPIFTGPQTPWPNRAEASIRLFKRQWILMGEYAREDSSLEEVTCRSMVQACTWARNNSAMMSGFSPIELATGRRPTPLFDPENATPTQLTTENTCAEDYQDQKIKALALRAHIAAKQDMDLRADLARRILPSEGPFEPGERVFYWVQNNSLKAGGKWIPAKVLRHEGPMVLLEDQNRVVKLNQSKIIKDRDAFHDIPLPESLSQEKKSLNQEVQEEGEGSPTDELLKKFQKWEREDPEAETFVFSKRGGPIWKHVIVRKTYDRESNLLIAEEYVQHIPAKELGRVLPDNIRQGIRTELYFQPHAEPSKLTDDLYHPLPDKEEEILFSSEYNMDVAECFWLSQPKGKLNFLELFAGKAILSYCCSQVGLLTGSPIDLNTGYDLNTYEGQQKAWKIIKEGQPDIILMAVVCSPWSNLQNINNQFMVYKKRKKAMPMVLFCISVALYQLSHGRKFLIENPETSHLWKLKEMTTLLQKPGVTWNVADMCRHGMKDPGSKLPYKKSVCLLHNFPEGSLDPVFLRCRKGTPHFHDKHERVEGYCAGYGRRSTLSQVYPFSFCKRLAICFLEFLKPRRQPRTDDRQTFFIDDVLAVTEITTDEAIHMSEVFSSYCDETSLGVAESVFATTTDTVDVRVKDQLIAKAMTCIDSLPANTTLDLSQAQTKREKAIAECARTLRRFYFPKLIYHRCTAVRGTVEGYKSVLTEDQNALVMYWYKNERPRKVFLSQGKQWLDRLTKDIKTISALIFWSPESEVPSIRQESPPELKEKIPPFVLPPEDKTRSIGTQTEYSDPDEPLDWHSIDSDSTIDQPPPIRYPPTSPPGHREPRRERTPNPPRRIRPPQGGGTVAPPNGLRPPQGSQGDPIPDPDETFPIPDSGEGALVPEQGGSSSDPPWWLTIFGKKAQLVDKDSQLQKVDHYDPAMDEGDNSSPSNVPIVINPMLPIIADGQPSQPYPISVSSQSSVSQGPQSVSHSLTDPIPISSSSSERPISIHSSSRTQPISVQSSASPQPVASAQPSVISVESSERTIQYDNDTDDPITIDDDDDEVETIAETALLAQSSEYALQNTDIVVEESSWAYLSAYHKCASNTASFQQVHVNGRSPTLFDCLALTDKPTKRKEASKQELEMYKAMFQKAKEEEYESWLKNNVFQFVKLKQKPDNFVTGRWVLTVKRDKQGNFLKCKARWVLRGFQDKQKYEQQTDSPTATRPGFRLACQQAASRLWHLGHIDLKTAFLQGEEYDTDRQVICQLPPDVGAPPGTAAKLVRPAYGLNDAPRRWWNKIDGSIQSFGMIPTRADRCTYVLYSEPKKQVLFADQPVSQPEEETFKVEGEETQSRDHNVLREFAHLATMTEEDSEKMLEYLLDPITGSPARNKRVEGVLCLHVDDLFFAGSEVFEEKIIKCLSRDYQIGSRDKDDITFTGQHVKWDWENKCIVVDQDKAIEDLDEAVIPKGSKDTDACNPQQHTLFRSILGGLNWLQSRTQFHMAYKFSRSASAAAKPTIGDLKELNKTVRALKSRPVKLTFWHLPQDHSHGRSPKDSSNCTRIIGYPDASYRNNADKTSQRGQCIFLAAPRKEKTVHSYGSLVDFESSKIRRTTLSTTVAELYSFMKCYGTCQFLRGLWMDISGESSQIHMRTDANNLVTTAGTTHLPEQKETIHMIQMLRKELCSGAMHDLAHVKTEYCLSDCLTKHSAKPDNLIEAVETGVLPFVDAHPLYRTLIKHKAFLTEWLSQAITYKPNFHSFMGWECSEEYYRRWRQPAEQALACVFDNLDNVWVHDKQQGIVRCIHVKPRKRLCVPTDHCPVPKDQLKNRRMTVMQQNATVLRQVNDDWRTRQHKREPITANHWTGYTVFWVRSVFDRGK